MVLRMLLLLFLMMMLALIHIEALSHDHTLSKKIQIHHVRLNVVLFLTFPLVRQIFFYFNLAPLFKHFQYYMYYSLLKEEINCKEEQEKLQNGPLFNKYLPQHFIF